MRVSEAGYSFHLYSFKLNRMTPEKFKRKLAAILSADVKGYSRLMGEDEEATLRSLQEYKKEMASSTANGTYVLKQLGNILSRN